MDQQFQDSTSNTSNEPLILFLNRVITICVKALAVLMVLVIIWSVVDVIQHMVVYASDTVETIFNIDNLIALYGVFLASLIAIEVYMNIILYLKNQSIHVPLVLATALTAAARKVIILDYTKLEPHHVYALAAVILSVGITYWLVTRNSKQSIF